MLSACTSLPARVDRYAAAEGMERHVVAGAPFDHVLYSRQGDAPGDTLHVYIEGDGRPWLYGVLPAADPTPRIPYALMLMAEDPTPSVYLGRPCYFGEQSPPCDENDWTYGRYSDGVVDSMVTALTGFLDRQPARRVVLIGYSGGGALAALMADRLPVQVHSVITIAANLDTQRWTEQHGYLPLSDSINPMTAAQLSGIPNIHYSGSEDHIVASGIIQSFAHSHAGHYRQVDRFNHRCCWRESWLSLLQQADALIDNERNRETAQPVSVNRTPAGQDHGRPQTERR